MKYNEKYEVRLNEEQRNEIERFIKSTSRKNTAQCKVHAKILLYLDKNGTKPLSVKETSEKCKLHIENVYKIKKQYATEGMERVLYRKKREEPPVPAKVTGEVEAHIIAVACSSAPEGRKNWTMQLIADKIVLDGVVDSISDETVRRTLKKRNISLT
jgi:transposase